MSNKICKRPAGLFPGLQKSAQKSSAPYQTIAVKSCWTRRRFAIGGLLLGANASITAAAWSEAAHARQATAVVQSDWSIAVNLASPSISTNAADCALEIAEWCIWSFASASTNLESRTHGAAVQCRC